MIAAKPAQVTKVREFQRSLDDQDPMYWALFDLLEAYDNYTRAERALEKVFGRGSADRLLELRKSDGSPY